MSKRFTDTEKWKKDWFINLSKDAKILWFYITDNCDFAGICDFSEKIFSVMLDFKITKEKINSLLGDKIQWIEENKFLIPSFIDFQYGNLNPKNRVHGSILEKISKIKEAPYKGLNSPLNGAKEEEEDKEEEKEKRECEGEKPKTETKSKSFTPPKIDEVKTYFKESGFSEQLAERFFNSYSVANWIDSHGKQIKNWKQKAIQVWFRDEDKTPVKWVPPRRNIGE